MTDLTPEELEALNAQKKDGNTLDEKSNDISQKGNDLLAKYLETHTGVNKSIQSYLSSQRDITSALQMQIKAVEDIRIKQDLKSTLNLSRQVTNAIQNSIGPYNDIAAVQKEQAKNAKLLAKLELDHKALLGGTREEQQSIKQELEEILAVENKSKHRWIIKTYQVDTSG